MTVTSLAWMTTQFSVKNLFCSAFAQKPSIDNMITSQCDHLEVPQYIEYPSWMMNVIARTTSDELDVMLIIECKGQKVTVLNESQTFHWAHWVCLVYYDNIHILELKSLQTCFHTFNYMFA